MEETNTNGQVGNKSNNAMIIGVVLVILVLGGAFMFFKGQATPNANDTTQESQVQPTTGTSSVMESTNDTTNTATESGDVKTFTVTSSGFSFTPKEIKVNKGDKVKITFVNGGGSHDLVIDEFKVVTPILTSGKSADVEFVADKAGTFEYYCSVANHRAMGMKGNLIVE